MRLPFSSRKGQDSESPRRSSIPEEEPVPRSSEEHSTQTSTTTDTVVGDDSSERSTLRSNSTALDTPATSYSSYSSSHYDREAKKSGMYKLSVVDNSGTFLPPSPPDHGRENGNRAWSLHRKQNNKSRERVASGDGPFIISRQSFEGYRRSFDIGGTSPTLVCTSQTFSSTPRLSLDSNISTRNGLISSRTESKLRVTSVPKLEEGVASEAPFEDVKLEDDEKASRRTILSRFGFGQRTANFGKRKEGEELQSLRTEN